MEQWRERLAELEAELNRVRKREGDLLEAAEALRADLEDRNDDLSALIERLKEEMRERETTSRTLLAAKQRMRGLLDAIPDLVFRLDSQGVFLDFKAARREELALAPADFLGKPIADVMPPRISSLTIEHIEKAIKTQEVQTYQYNLTMSGGDERVFETRMVAEEDGDIVCIIRDITEQNEAFVNLRESEDRYRQMFENMRSAVATYEASNDGEDFVFTGFNRAAERIENISRDEVLGRLVTDVFPEVREFGLLHAFRRVWKAGEAEQHPISLYEDDRVIGWRENFVYKLPSGEIIAIYDDLTEQKKEEQIRQEERLKLQTIESLGVLAGGIAHDFNNILTTVMGNVSMVQSSRICGSGSNERLAEAMKGVERARALTSQLLTFSKDGAPIRETESMREVLEDSVQFALRGSNVRAVLDIAPDLWHANVDRSQIGRVVHNLLVNADQAMPGGGVVEVEARNHIVASEDDLTVSPGKYVLVTVRDHGVGMDPQAEERIFEPFFTTRESGTGLGLSICFSIVKAHDGYITFQSVRGEGTAFHVGLPASDELQSVAREGSPETIAGRGRILVMDDQDDIRVVLAEMLTELGYEPHSSADGDEAIRLFEEARTAGTPFDAVVMDLTVPGGLGGVETVARLRQLDPNLKAVVSSGYSSDPVMSEYRDHGFSGAITKPFGLERLSAVMHTVLHHCSNGNSKGFDSDDIPVEPEP